MLPLHQRFKSPVCSGASLFGGSSTLFPGWEELCATTYGFWHFSLHQALCLMPGQMLSHSE